MSNSSPVRDLATHKVTNQPGPMEDCDLYASDPALITHASAAGADVTHLAGYGEKIGTRAMREAGHLANRHTPDLISFDPGGRRLDEVHYHPAYHQLLKAGIGGGYTAIAWEGRSGGHATHAAMVYQTTQVEPGVCCPMTMTYAAVPTLVADRTLLDQWVPKLTARAYDGAPKPLARKPGATLGMAMTEKQGGSDLRAITTRAERDDDTYRLTGHKWFCSAPMSDGFLTLAQAPEGLTCFLVPRWADGTRNRIHIQRLKDKLGNRANASAEIEYHGAIAHRLGDEGAGITTIMEMVHHTRLDTALAPAGLMRAALVRAHHWARHRSAFQKQLIDQPLMRAVLADLALDWEGTLALGLHVAQAFDGKTERTRAYARLSVGLAKFLGNKLCPGVVYEAMEAMGGAGYSEETGLPLFYREAPLNSIWEGAGNVICLDVLRALKREPLAGEVLSEELGKAAGQFRRFDAAMKAHMHRFPKPPEEGQARWYVESLATLLTAAVLIRTAPTAVSDAYIATRLTGERGRVAGAIGNVDLGGVLARLGCESSC